MGARRRGYDTRARACGYGPRRTQAQQATWKTAGRRCNCSPSFARIWAAGITGAAARVRGWRPFDDDVAKDWRCQPRSGPLVEFVSASSGATVDLGRTLTIFPLRIG